MMKLTKAICLASALLHSPATALLDGNKTEVIQWGRCAFNGTLSVVCGNVSVPMDYTEQEAGGSLVLQVVKVPALVEPSRGSILFNFGGPGGEAQQSLVTMAFRLMNTTGGEYDLVAFDPRGTGTTIPFSCYESAEAATLGQWTKRDVGTNSSDVAVGQLWAQAKLKSDVCKSGPGNATGPLLGTPFVARDFIKVVDALGEDGMLRYWGFSYGTALGATIASMFPERIDRMLLDAVMNVHEYYHGFETESVVDADRLLRAFIDECTADPDYCELGRNTTSDQLETNIYDLLYQINLLYSPLSWPIALAPALHGLMTGNLSDVANLERFSADPSRPPPYSEPLAGIHCLDKNRRVTELDDLRPVLDAFEAQSRLYGDGVASLATRCARWDFESKERYTGNFSAKTRHPVLLIGNSLDPITPLASAYNLSASLEGSVVLEQKGYGHSTLAQLSTCSNNAIREYFQTGELPEPGTKCEVDNKRVFRIGTAAGSAVQEPLVSFLQRF